MKTIIIKDGKKLSDDEITKIAKQQGANAIVMISRNETEDVKVIGF